MRVCVSVHLQTVSTCLDIFQLQTVVTVSGFLFSETLGRVPSVVLSPGQEAVALRPLA